MRTFKLKLNAFLIVSAILILLYAGCSKEQSETDDNGSHPMLMEVPEGFPAPIVSAENPLTTEGIALGRLLYYDSMLSSGGPLEGLACASCHLQSKGFIKPGLPVLAHVNLAWNRNFLWKGDVTGTLEDIMRFEVNDFFQTDLSGIKGKAIYEALFDAAFGTPEITPERTALALSQFARTLVSGHALFDLFLQKKAIYPRMQNAVIYCFILRRAIVFTAMEMLCLQTMISIISG